MNKRLLIGLILFLLLSTYNIQSDFKILPKLNIEKIILENNDIVDESLLKRKLSFLYGENIIFFNNNEIAKKLDNLDFIESFEIKRIYPNKIIIKIFEKTPIAILQNKKNKFYYTSNGDLINFFKIEKFDNLPIVFGDKKNFSIFVKKLKEINFPLDQIKTFYFFEINRWDLTTKKNQIIKLPIQGYDESLLNFIELDKRDNFDKFKLFDYRINNQLILK